MVYYSMPSYKVIKTLWSQMLDKIILIMLKNYILSHYIIDFSLYFLYLQDSLSLPPKLDAMEVALIHTKAELKELRRMAAESYVLRDKAIEQLHEMQQETFEARRARLELLEETKAEVERRKEDLQANRERNVRVRFRFH